MSRFVVQAFVHVWFDQLETNNHTGKPAFTTKSSFLCAPRRFFASVGQTIGFRRLLLRACGPRNFMKNWKGGALAAEALVRFGLPRIFNGLHWFFDPALPRQTTKKPKTMVCPTEQRSSNQTSAVLPRYRCLRRSRAVLQSPRP